MSESNVIDTALSAAAGTILKELEPAAVTAFEDLKAFVHEKADRLRGALPGLEQAAVDHVHSVTTAVLQEYEHVLARIEAHLGGAPAGTTVAPGETSTASNPAVPDQPDAAPVVETPAPTAEVPVPDAPEGTVPDPAGPATGMAPPAGEPVAETTPEA